MKKYFNFLFIGLLILFAFVACDNDATSGILSDIVNSEIQEEYTFKSVVTNASNDKYYSLEDNDIYLSSDATSKRELILNLDNYTNTNALYYDGTDLYFLVNGADAATEGKKLYYFDPTVATPIVKEMIVDNTTVGSIVSLTSNGYLIFENSTSGYYAQKIISHDTTINTTDAIKFAETTDSLSTIVPVNNDLIVQTVFEDPSNEGSYLFNYYLIKDGSSSLTTIKEDQEEKIVSAASNDSITYYLVLSNASLSSTDGSILTEIYVNDNTNYSFDNLAQNLYFSTSNFLVAIDSSNDVLLYDLANADNDSSTGLTSLTEGFANVIRNTSSIVSAFKITATDPYKFQIATKSNGYYLITVTDSSELSNNDNLSSISSCDSVEYESTSTN
ncbi:MAG: hypothetical protein ACPKOI_12680 [Pleomorphochaeta sp.]